MLSVLLEACKKRIIQEPMDNQTQDPEIPLSDAIPLRYSELYGELRQDSVYRAYYSNLFLYIRTKQILIS